MSQRASADPRQATTWPLKPARRSFALTTETPQKMVYLPWKGYQAVAGIRATWPLAT